MNYISLKLLQKKEKQFLKGSHRSISGTGKTWSDCHFPDYTTFSVLNGLGGYRAGGRKPNPQSKGVCGDCKGRKVVRKCKKEKLKLFPFPS